MFEIFMAVCALTLLECNDITVEYYPLPEENWHAAAAIDEDNNYYIFVNTTLEDKSEKFMKRLMVHEVAHLVAFGLDPIVIDHSPAYVEICRDLAALAEVKSRYTCSPYDTPLPPWWTGGRRE